MDAVKKIKKIARSVLLDWKIMQPRLKDEKYKVGIKTNFHTAYWQYEDKTHYIMIGDGVTKIIDPAKFSKGIRSVCIHEFGHSIYTYRDIKKLSKILEREKIPFGLLNIFEDCRIEHNIRNDFLYVIGRKSYIQDPKIFGVGDSTPESLMLSFKFFDGDIQEAKKAFIDAGGDSAVADRVEEYFQRTINVQDTLSLIPILKEWIEEFGTGESELEELLQKILQAIAGLLVEQGESEEEAGKNAEGIGKAIGAIPDLDVEGECDPKEDIKSAEEVDTEDSEKEARGNKREKVTPSGKVEEFSDMEILETGYSESYDKRLAKRMVKAFEKALAGVTYTEPSKRFSKRLYAKNAVLERENEFKKVVHEKPKEKEVAIILDCSGSMGYPMRDMKVIIHVLNHYAKQGLLHGHLILSSGRGCETFKLPIPMEKIKLLEGRYGSEGIEQTMRKTLPLLKKADWVFVLTDGDLTDMPVDKQYFKKQGVYTYGIYIGPEAKNLSKWFNVTINHKTVEATVYDLVKKLKK